MTKTEIKSVLKILADIIKRDLLEDRSEYGVTDLCHCYNLSTAQGQYLLGLIALTMRA